MEVDLVNRDPNNLNDHIKVSCLCQFERSTTTTTSTTTTDNNINQHN